MFTYMAQIYQSNHINFWTSYVVYGVDVGVSGALVFQSCLQFIIQKCTKTHSPTYDIFSHININMSIKGHKIISRNTDSMCIVRSQLWNHSRTTVVQLKFTSSVETDLLIRNEPQMLRCLVSVSFSANVEAFVDHVKLWAWVCHRHLVSIFMSLCLLESILSLFYHRTFDGIYICVYVIVYVCTYQARENDWILIRMRVSCMKWHPQKVY